MADQFEAWNLIAQSFDATRNRTWGHVEAFLDAQAGAPILDVMCGNGRHLRPGMVGLDWSEGLVAAAAGRGVVVRGDATRLPFASSSFSAAIYVAGLHGIPEPRARIASLRELRRVVDGAAQVTVWSRGAPRFARLDLPPGPADLIVPWKRDGHHVERFYHLYDEASLRADCEAAGWHVSRLASVAIAADSPDNLVAELRPAVPG